MQPNPSYSDLYALFDIMEIRGRYGDKVCAVTSKGKQYVRDLGNMTAERVKTDPKFANSRALNSEFGIVAKLSAAIRNGLGKMATDMAPKKAQHNKMTAHLTNHFNHWPGERGTRYLSAARIATEFQPYTWRKNGPTTLSPNGQIWTTYEPLTEKPIVHFAFMGTPKYPNWATHVRPVFKMIAISDLKYNPKTNAYEPIHPALHGTTRTVHGTLNDLRQPTPEAANWGTWSWQPHKIYPEAAIQGIAFITVIGIECLILNPDETIQNTKFHAIQNAFCGEITIKKPKNPTNYHLAQRPTRRHTKKSQQVGKSGENEGKPAGRKKWRERRKYVSTQTNLNFGSEHHLTQKIRNKSSIKAEVKITFPHQVRRVRTRPDLSDEVFQIQ